MAQAIALLSAIAIMIFDHYVMGYGASLMSRTIITLILILLSTSWIALGLVHFSKFAKRHTKAVLTAWVISSIVLSHMEISSSVDADSKSVCYDQQGAYIC